MADFRRSKSYALMLGAALAVAGCSDGFDLDLRDLGGGFDTTDAVRQPTERRPNPDARGIISYPNYQVAVARRGDTISDVAARAGVDAEELARYNGIPAGTALRRGEVVVLPAGAAPPTALGTGAPGPSEEIDIATLADTALDRAERQDPPPQSAAPAPPTQTGPEPIRHKVARGETAYSISRLYNVSVRSLADWNGLGPDLGVREGQVLLIPVAAQPVETAARDPEPVVTDPGEGSVTPEPPSASKPLPDDDTETAATTAPPSPNLAGDRTAASDRSEFMMPVTGSVIRGYEKGVNDGIDIAAAPGTAVRAAGDGTVAAITRDTDQVPILVLRHPGNLLTVYANIDGVKFAKGDKVSRGQAIAEVRETEPSFLHFEVREGFESADPVPYIN
ncbi:MAG: LysM peptidoglycan-binding domain-containing M23 family metallopeptidase [Rhodobacter sp.]|nr:LysM peptidoglycan-binding domain-containing M23 family metallopeptidase [Rhodobacter sp.]